MEKNDIFSSICHTNTTSIMKKWKKKSAFLPIQNASSITFMNSVIESHEIPFLNY